MAKQELTAREFPRRRGLAGFAAHLSDGLRVATDTQDAEDGYSLPIVRIRDGEVELSLFFETTAQMTILRDALSDYLRGTSITRPDSERAALVDKWLRVVENSDGTSDSRSVRT